MPIITAMMVMTQERAREETVIHEAESHREAGRPLSRSQADVRVDHRGTKADTGTMQSNTPPYIPGRCGACRSGREAMPL
jgi:hypothetical protein